MDFVLGFFDERCFTMSNACHAGSHFAARLAVIGKLPSRQHHMIRAFFIELEKWTDDHAV
jgi:hypothetical protein